MYIGSAIVFVFEFLFQSVYSAHKLSPTFKVLVIEIKSRNYIHVYIVHSIGNINVHHLETLN